MLVTLISNGPLRLSEVCSVDTAQSKSSSHVNRSRVGSARLAEQKPSNGRGNLIELAGSHPFCSLFPWDK